MQGAGCRLARPVSSIALLNSREPNARDWSMDCPTKDFFARFTRSKSRYREQLTSCLWLVEAAMR